MITSKNEVSKGIGINDDFLFIQHQLVYKNLVIINICV